MTLDHHVFISHASEDKSAIARPLALRLRQEGLRVWYDEFSLELGDSLTAAIDRSLASSAFGVVILSPAFFTKSCPMKELGGLVSRPIDGTLRIIPVWHNVSYSEVVAHSPTLADLLAANTAIGIDAVAEQSRQVVGTSAAIGTESQALVGQPGDADAPLTADSLIQYLHATFQHFVAQGLIPTLGNPRVQEMVLLELKRMSLASIGDFDRLVPTVLRQPDWVGLPSASFLGLVRTILIAADPDRYFAQIWLGDWKGLSPQSLDALLRLGVPIVDLAKEYGLTIR